MFKKKYFFLYIIFIASLTPAFSQKTAKFYEPGKEYRKAVHLFERQQFGAALITFEKINEQLIRKSEEPLSEEATQIQIQASYYIAVCGLELYHRGAEKNLMAFVEKYPEQPLAKTASFELGNFYYRQKQYDTAIEWYKKTEVYLLSNSMRNEYDFRYGYSLNEKGEKEEASELFQKLIPKNSKYSYPAAYYDGLIQYEKKNYKLAIERFEFLKGSKTYAEFVPHYLLKIYYEQKDYDKVLSYAPEALAVPQLKNSNEVLLIAASASFAKKDWTKTIDYYEQAARKAPLSDLNTYELGFAYFQTQMYQKSIDKLKVLSEKKVPYSQHALYVMGQAFYELKDKPSARNAFLKSSKLDSDPEVTASALINYSKLSFELNFYQTAIESLQEFLNKFPQSEDVEDAQSLLGEALLYTRNYKQAISILEKLQPRTTSANKAYQKVTYYRGLELFNEGKFAEAIKMFNSSLTITLDKNIQAYSWYWKGEAYYQMKNYDDALKNFSMFSQADVRDNAELNSSVNYQLGYTYYKKGDYKSSIVYFDRYLKSEAKLNNINNLKKVNDATLRMSDGYFVIKDYDKALFSYNKIINDKATGSDYALFQKGMILGLQNKQNDKIVTLKSLLNNYPKSPYGDDATYEIGNGYFIMNTIPDAIQYFLSLIQQYPNSRYVAKSRLSLGLIYYNESQDEKALSMYKAIIDDYPGSQESKEALLAIKNIYLDAGNSDAYLAYVKTLPFASVSSGAQDSITYQAANNRYLAGDCESAINGFNNYLEKFSGGYFILDAHANRAECFLKTKREKSALIDFEFLIQQSNPKYLERSLLYAARIQIQAKDFIKAAKYYTQLEQQAEFKDNYGEAISGAMKSYASLNDSAGIFKYTQRVLNYEKSSNEDQYLAYLYQGRLYYSVNNIDEAEKAFRSVAKMTRTEPGAEAKYMIAEILYKKGKYLDAQQACFDLSNQVPSYEYWVAKGFIILAGTYSKLGNDFQAKSTLQSIIDEYSNPNDGIIATAKIKLEELSQPK